MKQLFERYAEWNCNIATRFVLKYGGDPRPIRKLSGQLFVGAVWLLIIFSLWPLQHCPQLSNFVIGILLVFSGQVFAVYLGVKIGANITNHLDNREGKKDLDKDSDTL